MRVIKQGRAYTAVFSWANGAQGTMQVLAEENLDIKEVFKGILSHDDTDFSIAEGDLEQVVRQRAEKPNMTTYSTPFQYCGLAAGVVHLHKGLLGEGIMIVAN